MPSVPWESVYLLLVFYAKLVGKYAVRPMGIRLSFVVFYAKFVGKYAVRPMGIRLSFVGFLC